MGRVARVGALGRGEAPHGSPWRRPCDEQEEAPRVKREGGLHPLDLTVGPQQSGPGKNREG